MKITYVSHSCVLIEYNGKTIVTDPFFKNTEAVKKKLPKLFAPDYIVLTHGHGDHIGSLEDILSPSSTVVGIVELCSFLRKKGVKNTKGLNFGGTISFGDISFSPVPARHTSSFDGTYLGEAAGFIIKVGEHTIYHFGDTDAFGDMSLIQQFHHPDIGLVPIGGYYTLDEDRAAYCCNTYFSFETVIPIHFNTFREIQATPERFARSVRSKTIVLNPFEQTEFR